MSDYSSGGLVPGPANPNLFGRGVVAVLLAVDLAAAYYFESWFLGIVALPLFIALYVL